MLSVVRVASRLGLIGHTIAIFLGGSYIQSGHVADLVVGDDPQQASLFLVEKR